MLAYGFKEVLELTGCSRSELIHWSDSSAIKAEVQEAEGPGKHRKFSFGNLVQVSLARELKSLGVRPEFVKGFLESFAALNPDALDREAMASPSLTLFRHYRNPGLRREIDLPEGTLAILVVTFSPMAFQAPEKITPPETPVAAFNSVLFVGEPDDFELPKLKQPNKTVFLIYLSNIIEALEQKTRGDWWDWPGYFTERALTLAQETGVVSYLTTAELEEELLERAMAKSKKRAEKGGPESE